MRWNAPLVSSSPHRVTYMNHMFGAFVINLDSRPDRLAEFRRRTRGFAFPIERFAALTPQQLVQQGHIANPSAWSACNASHFAVYRLVLERGLDWALVLEDDVLPIIGFERRVRWALHGAPPEAWLIQLGYLGSAGSRVRRVLRSVGGHARPSMNVQRCEQYWWGSQAYLISKRFAEFVLAQPPPRGPGDGTHSHDRFMRALSVETEFQHHCYVHHPNLAGQSLSTSDIGNQRDAADMKPHGLREWRRLMP